MLSGADKLVMQRLRRCVPKPFAVYKPGDGTPSKFDMSNKYEGEKTDILIQFHTEFGGHVIPRNLSA
jgi:hypothetical protein